MKGRLHNERVAEIQSITGRSPKEINIVLDLFYQGVYDKLSKPIDHNDELLSEEELNKKFKSLIIPRLGTFRVNYKKYINSKKHLKK